MFRDRTEAGKLLARALEAYRTSAVVLALPRGGVVLGYEVAHALGVPLDIVVSRKIGHPLHPEYAIGVVDERGERILNELEAAGVDQDWLAEESKRQQEEAARRVKLYRGGRPPAVLAGKVVILVDDGIATGLTMQLAVRSIRQQRPEKIVVAVPVAPSESLQMLAQEGAEVVVLEPPEDFAGAVGAHYERFEQVEDDEVIKLLQHS
ncbi:MAG: phosphoribosyltransferase family protein [Patescibacteria group bacterium]